jgi:outer membrane protein
MFGHKKYVKAILVIWLAMLSGGSAWAQRTLTLEEAIKVALQNNKSIQISRSNLNIAKSRIIQARSNFLPHLGSNGTYTWWEKTQNMEIPAGVFGPEPISMSLDFSKDYVAAFSLSQPLFTSGRIWQSYKISELGLKVAEEDYKEQEQIVIFSTKKAFYDLLLAQQFVGVTEEALSLAEEHLRITKVRFNAGEASEFEVLRAEVEVANLRPQVIKAKNNVKLATLGLKNTLGLGLEGEIEIEGEFEKEASYPNLDICLKTAFENRPELARLGYQRETAQRGVKLAKVNNWPSLSAVVNYQWQSQKLFYQKEWEDTYSGFLVLSIPLFDGFYTRGKVRESKATLEGLDITEKQLKDGVELEVRQSYLSLLESSEIIKSSEENVTQAKKNVEIAEDQFGQGYVTSLDVMSTQLALTTAKTNYIQALYDYTLAVAQLDKATGTIK